MQRKVTKRRRLKLATTNCTLFSVTIEVSDKDFLSDEFLGALPFQEARKHFSQYGHFISTCSRKTNQIDYRADVNIHKLLGGPKDGGVAVHVVLWPARRGLAKGEKPPFAEEIFQWVRQFIRNDTSVELSERCEFLFPAREYRSAFSLPLHMSGTLNYTGHPAFENSLMSGVRIIVRDNQVGVTSATQDYIPGKGIMVSVSRRTNPDPGKLLTVETDVNVIYNIAKSTVRPTGKLK